MPKHRVGNGFLGKPEKVGNLQFSKRQKDWERKQKIGEGRGICVVMQNLYFPDACDYFTSL